MNETTGQLRGLLDDQMHSCRATGYGICRGEMVGAACWCDALEQRIECQERQP